MSGSVLAIICRQLVELRVLAREEDTTKRKIKEAPAIKKLTNGRKDHVINNLDSGMNISNLWLDLFKSTHPTP